MKSKVFSLLLCILLILPLLALPASAMTPSQAADVDGDGAVTARDAAILARFTAGWDDYVDARGNLTYPWKSTSQVSDSYVKSFDPASPVDFQGYTFRILSWGGTDNGTRDFNGQTVRNFSITHFSVKDVCPWTAGTWSDSGTYAQYYTRLSQVVAERNAYLESAYNCHIEELRTADPFAELMADSYSGTDSFDLTLLPIGKASNGYNAQSLFTMGLLENVLNVPTVDVTRPWYDTELLQRITLDEKLLFLTGASDSTLRQAVFLPLIGLKNVSDAYGTLSDEQAAANFVYDLVLNGKWTVEKMTEILNTCYNNYPSGVHYTYSAAAYNNIVFALGAGYTAYNANGQTLFPDFSSCPSYTAWSELCDLLTSHRTTDELDKIQGGRTGSTHVARAIGVSVYCYKSAYNSTSTNNWIAAVPFPKANVDQAGYITTPNLSFVCMYAIPVGNAARAVAGEYGFESGRDMEGYFASAFMEASLAEHNKKGYDVKDAILYQLAERGSFHNSALKTTDYPQGKPLAALQMIYDGLTVDPVLLYAPNTYSPLSACGADPAAWSGVEEKYNGNFESQSKSLDSMSVFLSLE